MPRQYENNWPHSLSPVPFGAKRSGLFYQRISMSKFCAESEPFDSAASQRSAAQRQNASRPPGWEFPNKMAADFAFDRRGVGKNPGGRAYKYR